ncbi:MAG: hypothetical protein WCE94_04970 [Candidatus Methanoperedens sp.]
MMFAKKCPKCGGNVQTKSIKKSIGLGFVNIPVAQFCLNPVCDWYQDFAEAKEPEEIKTGFQIKVPSIKTPEFKKPNLSQKHIIALAAVVVIIGIYILSSYLIPVSPKPQQPEVPKTDTPLVNTTQPYAVASPQTTAAIPEIKNSTKYSVNMDIAHGFKPQIITINRYDTVVWINQEDQRPRIVLISKENLFKNQIIQYSGDRFSYQFNQSGNYAFALAAYDPINHTSVEYPNIMGYISVN